MISLQENQPGGKTHNRPRWATKHTILIIALVSLIVAVGTVAVIIYMGLTTHVNTSLQQQSHIKWQDRQFGPLAPVDLSEGKTWAVKKP